MRHTNGPAIPETPTPAILRHLDPDLDVRGTDKETVLLNFPGHTNAMRASTLKITICPNVTVSEGLMFPLNLAQSMISMFNCLSSPFTPPTKQVCQAAVEWIQKWPRDIPDRMPVI